LTGLLDRFGAQLAAAFGGGVRLGGEQPGVQVGGFRAVARWTAQPGTAGRSAFFAGPRSTCFQM